MKKNLRIICVCALMLAPQTHAEKSWTCVGIAERPTTQLAPGRTRFVRLQLKGEGWLNLAEVEVWGKRDSSATSENLALGKPASQSSTADNDQAVAGLAVDGNTSGIFAEHSISHTNREQDPWWEVDLGEVCTIQEVRVWNRCDGVEDRLKNLSIIFSDKPFAIQVTQIVKDLSPEPSETIYPKAWGYLRLPVFSTCLLLLAWLIHLFIWNCKIPVFPIRILISVFSFVFFAGTVFAIILPSRVRPIKDIWEYLLVLDFYGSIALLYISSYEWINHKGSIYPLLQKLLQSGTKGLSQETLMGTIERKTQHDVEFQVELLQNNKHIRTDGQVMILTNRGKLCGTIIDKYFRWLD